MRLAFTRLFGASTQRIEVIALALLVCLGIFELVRRKRLLERYAIVWLVAGICVLVLALWKGLLTTLAHTAGIYYPPSALFAVISFAFQAGLIVYFLTSNLYRIGQNAYITRRFFKDRPAVATAGFACILRHSG